MTVLLDSSGWIELLAGSERADLYRPALRAKRLVVPAIVRYEVARYSLVHGGEVSRELAISALAKFDQVPIDESLVDAAAELAHQHKLAMADALVYAASKSADAELWTQDRQFEHLSGVRFFPKS